MPRRQSGRAADIHVTTHPSPTGDNSCNAPHGFGPAYSQWSQVLHWPPQPLAAWAWGYLVVFGSLLAFNAYMVLLARTPAGLAASYTFVNPVIALLLGIIFGGESVTLQEWAATGVILAGVILLLAGSVRRGGRGR